MKNDPTGALPSWSYRTLRDEGRPGAWAVGIQGKDAGLNLCLQTSSQAPCFQPHFPNSPAFGGAWFLWLPSLPAADGGENQLTTHWSSLTSGRGVFRLVTLVNVPFSPRQVWGWHLSSAVLFPLIPFVLEDGWVCFSAGFVFTSSQAFLSAGLGEGAEVLCCTRHVSMEVNALC